MEGVDQQTKPPEYPDVPDDYLRRFNAGIRTFDPVEMRNDAAETVVTKLFDTLFYSDSGRETEPLLAADAETDGLTFRVTLESDAVFHDGQPVTAEDVVYTMERIAASPNSVRTRYLFDSLGVTHERENGEYVPGTLGVRAADESTVVFERDSATTDPTQVLSHPTFSIHPAGSVDDVPGIDGEMSQEEFAYNPIGCGPFELNEWVESEGSETGHVIVDRFDDYYDNVPDLGGVVWVTNVTGDERFAHLQRGTVDATGTPDTNYDKQKVNVERTDGRTEFGTYGPLENGETLNMALFPTTGCFYLGFVAENVPLEIRRAVADVLNQHSETEAAFGANYDPAYHVTRPGALVDADVVERHREGYPYGVDERRMDSAQRRVESLGYSPENPYELEFITQYTQEWSVLSDRLHEDLLRIGIHLESNVVNAVEQRERVDNGDAEMYFGGWIVDWATLQNKLTPLSPEKAYWPDNEVPHEEWDALLSAEDGTEAAREAAFRLEEANWEQLPIIPLYHNYSTNVWYDRVSFNAAGPLGIRRRKYTEVSVEGSPGLSE